MNDSNSGSLDAFPCGNDDEGDDDVQVCNDSADFSEVEQRMMFWRRDNDGGEGMRGGEGDWPMPPASSGVSSSDMWK